MKILVLSETKFVDIDTIEIDKTKIVDNAIAKELSLHLIVNGVYATFLENIPYVQTWDDNDLHGLAMAYIANLPENQADDE